MPAARRSSSVVRASRERLFGGIGLVQTHAARRRKQDNGSGSLFARALEQAAQRIRVIRARAAAEKSLVLRRDEDRRAEDRRARQHDAVVGLRLDFPTCEVRRRPRRGQRLIDVRNAAGISDGADSIAGSERAQCQWRGMGGQRVRHDEIARSRVWDSR